MSLSSLGPQERPERYVSGVHMCSPWGAHLLRHVPPRVTLQSKGMWPHFTDGYTEARASALGAQGHMIGKDCDSSSLSLPFPSLPQPVPLYFF